MNKAGKPAKALKLFHHALAIQPNHPDILNNYGEFLENTEKNVLDADYRNIHNVFFPLFCIYCSCCHEIFLYLV